MASQILKDQYKKINLIKRTPQKEVWVVKNLLDGEMSVGKVQPLPLQDCLKSSHTRTVLHQGKFLQTVQGHSGVPSLHWAGKDQHKGVSVVIVQKLGDTIEDKFDRHGPFSLGTVCQLGIRMIKMIQDYHEKGYIHGGLKLNSFQLGCGSKSSQLFFNDLTYSHSMARKGKSGKRQICKNKLPFNQFMSLDRMIGYQCYRKDDIQSIVLLLIYLLRARLPWTNSVNILNSIGGHRQFQCEGMGGGELSCSLDMKEKSTQETIGLTPILNRSQQREHMKHGLLTKIDGMSRYEICKDLPVQFSNLVLKCRQLEYQDRPDYNYFIRALRKVMLKNKCEEQEIYDWMKPRSKELSLPAQFHKDSFNFTITQEQQILKECYDPYSQKIALE